MSTTGTCIYSKQSGKLQIPYGDYLALMEKVMAGQRMKETALSVAVTLEQVLGKNGIGSAVPKGKASKQPFNADAVAPAKKEPSKPTPAATAKSAPAPVAVPEPVRAKKAAPQPAQPVARTASEISDIPPIKKDIVLHFNSLDESGRLFSVFKQYYACLNDQCGGTVRVTMKDGFCSLWNYDEWEEFSYVDIFEGHLRFAVDPRYTDELKSLNFCEVPRLLSSRRNLVCVQVDDLNNSMLDVLTKAFNEVGMTAS